MSLEDESLLTEISRLSAAAYGPKEIAFMLSMKPSEFCKRIKNEDDEFSIAYYKGLYSSELSIRESILLLGRNGSSPAQASSLQLFNNVRKELIKDRFTNTDEE